MSKSAADKRLVLIGAGRMGAALAQGWLADLESADVSELVVVEPQPGEDLARLADQKKIVLNPKTPAPADIVVLAVKPQAFTGAASSIAPYVGEGSLAISIMAGVTIKRIAALTGTAKVARAMPNTPGSIGRGVTGFCLSEACGADEQAMTENLLAPLGAVVGPLREDQMDAVTAVSGSGPAYVFLLAEALEAAARHAGLDAKAAAVLARETVAGAGALIAQSGQEPGDLRRAVTSPNGTTAAALDVLMAGGAMPDLMRKAVDAAVKRGAELAKEAEK